MFLSRRAKEALKTAIAMTIAYGIALSMDWEKPLWAGFAVAFISLYTVGQSVQKGLMRMLGTVAAVFVSLLLIALFPQERWWFMGALSAFLGLCTYMMDGKKYHYFWNVAGFVSVIICLQAGPDATNAFETALLRAEETGLGILVYSLVSVLLWPTSSLADFNAAACELASTQHRLYKSCLGRIGGRPLDDDVHAIRIKTIQAQSRFDQLLEAAVADSSEVWEVRAAWAQFQTRSKELMETLIAWSGTIGDVQDLDMNGLLPTWEDLTSEINVRFEQINRMLSGDAPDHTVRAIVSSLNTDEVRGLSHFRRAALASTRKQAHQIEDLTRTLFETIQYLKGFGSTEPPVAQPEETGPGFLLDLDRMTAAVRVMAGIWAAYLIWIYTQVPGGTTFVIMAAPFGMILATTPQLPLRLLLGPIAVSIAFAGCVYIFVMPEISSFAGLGGLIFFVTFAVCYVFSSPRQALARAFGLAMFVVVTAVSNTQTYSFLSLANTSLMMALILALLAVVAYVPVSPRPEKAFCNALRRFFRSAGFLTSHMALQPGLTPTLMARWKRAFHRREIKTLPAKLDVWAGAMDHTKFPANKPEQVQTLLTSVQTLAHGIERLTETRDAGQAKPLARELRDDLDTWCESVEIVFHRWSENLQPEPGVALREKLVSWMTGLDERIGRAMKQSEMETLDESDLEEFYRLLAAFRSVSEAVVAYAVAGCTIDWAQWREEVF